MNKKKLLIILIIILIIAALVKVFIKKKETGFTLAKVERGDIIQEVSATGTVKRGDELNLGFKTSGRIEKIFVKVGDNVQSNQTLAQLDNSSLLVQLSEAQAVLEVAQAKLDKLLSGSNPEEIKIYQTDVQNNQLALDTAKEDLVQSYEDALNTLDDSYLKLYNAFNTVETIQKKYFSGSDQESIKFKENKEVIELAFNTAKNYLDIAKTDNKNESIDVALSEMRNSCDKTSKSLTIIREVCDEGAYYSTVSPTDKTSIDTQRTNINTALTNITNTQQAISSMKLSVKSAEGQLRAAEDQLAKITAKPRQEDVDLYEAQVRQAEAQADLIKKQIEDTSLTSPIEGQVSKINKREGEIIQAALGDTFISLIPKNPFQIEVDIYEEDIVEINIGDPVDITLTAFPGKILKGKVVAIDPSEKLVEGVVYYRTTIDFDSLEEGIKPGMTADIVIKTNFKENVLFLPEGAIEKKDGKVMVKVLVGKNIQEKEIIIGLEGSDNRVEVLSGLNQGEEVIIQ